MKTHIGTAGWSYEDWNGVVYPDPQPKGFDPLTFLAQYFDTIEINNTFYRPPEPKWSHDWLKRTAHNSDFKFTLKLYQGFTHQNVGTLNHTDVSTFRSGIEPLAHAGKLGCVLIQFPWGFQNTPENRKWLLTLKEAFKDFPLVVEVRHNSWNAESAYQFLAEHHLNFCNIDQPVTRTSIAPSDRVTGEIGYVRLHGRNYETWFKKDAGRDERYNYLYTEAEIDEWIERIRHIEKSAASVFIIANNHFCGQAAVNALQLKWKLTGKRQDIPETLMKRFPFLIELAR
jgi:uncharacterized protein YecE (DUF72 family)